MATNLLNPFEIFGAVSAFTPIDLGSKLLNWWDGTIVDDSTTPGEVDNWLDQKGTIDWLNNGNKATYDDPNNLIIFESSKSEYLTAAADVAQFNRSTGEYWFVFNYVNNSNARMPLFTINDSGNSNVYFAIWFLTQKLFIDIRGGGSSLFWLGTTVFSSGKKIIRVKQDGVAIKIEVNGVDVTSEDFPNSAGARWESSIGGTDTVFLNASVRPTATNISDHEYNAMLRIGNVLTDQEATDLYDYLNAKY